jgi:regulator of protease activity HflC (stomatin/prohibitin superfamily)
MNITIVLSAVVTLLWLITAGLVAIFFVRASRGRQVRGVGIAILVAASVAFIVTIINAGLVFVQPEERGVVISAVAPLGYREAPLQPGLHWIIPFLENVRMYPISRQTYTMSKTQTEGQVAGDDSISARTADGQEVFVDASVIYSIDPALVTQVNIEWQDRYSGDLVRPVSRGVIRDAISQYGVEQVVSSKRGQMTQEISSALTSKLAANGITLEDFVLRNITFSPEYAASVEQKQISEQQAQQAKFIIEQKRAEAEQARQVAQGSADSAVIRAKGDAQSRLIQAEAETKALDLLATALKDNPALLNYIFVNKMGPGVQTVFLPNNVPYLLPLPTQNASSPASSPTDLFAPPLMPTPLAAPTAVPTAVPTPTP